MSVSYDTKMELLALLYGKPNPEWIDPERFYNGRPNATRFREVAFVVFHQVEIARVGVKRIAADFTEWYQLQEQSDETTNYAGTASDAGVHPRPIAE